MGGVGDDLGPHGLQGPGDGREHLLTTDQKLSARVQGLRA